MKRSELTQESIARLDNIAESLDCIVLYNRVTPFWELEVRYLPFHWVEGEKWKNIATENDIIDLIATCYLKGRDICKNHNKSATQEDINKTREFYKQFY